MEILGCFVEKQPLGVTEISEKLGLYKSNVHNILMTFKAMDYLEQDPETGKFSLGTAVFTLSRALKESLTISKVVLPYMHQIAKEAGELVYLAIPHEDEVVYLEAVYPEGQMLPGRSVTGERSKMYCTSVGKVILSQMTDEEVEGDSEPREEGIHRLYHYRQGEVVGGSQECQERRLCYGQHGEYLRCQMCGSSSAESPGQSRGRHEHQHPFPSHG